MQTNRDLDSIDLDLKSMSMMAAHMEKTTTPGDVCKTTNGLPNIVDE